MTSRRLFVAALLAVALIRSDAALARCEPKHTLKIVVSVEDANLPDDHFTKRPKTIYRSGRLFGRVEEEPNPITGRHMLVVVNAADLWIVNLADKSGQHAIDPGPSLSFRAPIVGDVDSEYWNNFEFGCEVPFMQAVGTETTAADATSGERVYEHTKEGATVQLVAVKGIPKRVTIETKERKFAFVYQSFEQLTNADPALFEKPSGITFTEATP
jgi:hypothetical protein